MRRAMGLAFALVTVASSAYAQSGTGGASCAARSDCSEGYRCVDNVCVDERKFLPSSEPGREKWNDKGTIGYLGASLGLTLPALWSTRSVGEAFVLGLRVGTVINRTFELQLDVSPMTTAFTNVTSSAFGMFDATGSIGFLIPLNDFTSWVSRLGGGGGAFVGFDGATIGFGEIRLDLFGVVIRTSKHLQIECHIPSYRVLLAPGSGYGMMWVTNVSLDYVF